jgi:hypothetical protein
MGDMAGGGPLTSKQARALEATCLLREISNAIKTGKMDYTALEECEKTIDKYSTD